MLRPHATESHHADLVHQQRLLNPRRWERVVAATGPDAAGVHHPINDAPSSSLCIKAAGKASPSARH